MQLFDKNDDYVIDPDDLNKNMSSNPHMQDLIAQRISRRAIMKGFGATSVALFGGVSLTACFRDDDGIPAPIVEPAPNYLSFKAVPKSLQDKVIVAEGYDVRIIYALGDPLTATTADYKNDGTDTDWENRAGDHHDGMEFYGVSASNQYDPNAIARGVLAINHEATTDEKLASHFIHANGGTLSLPRPAAEVDKELAIHGLSFVEVKQTNGVWSYVRHSTLNGRVTLNTPVEITGPLKGHAQLITRYSATATTARGTLNNCGAGKTPWGSYVSGEENWSGYFARNSDDESKRDAKTNASLKRYGRSQGAKSRHGWETAGAGDTYARWNISAVGATAAEDYRNEINTFGYIVEADPLQRSKAVRKRTALGRFAHETAVFGLTKAGEPLAVYQGDDSRNEYIYKYVSDAAWQASDANSSDVLATGDKYLNSGKLYAAKFNADGTGEWLALSVNNAAIKAYNKDGFTFGDNADIALYTRLAADAAGATKMDRPEWCTVHPTTGEIYFTLTNNSQRGIGSGPAVDAANPRSYEDVDGNKNKGNAHGHIIRMQEGTGGNAATTFKWDIYLFGAEEDANPNQINVSGLTADQDFSSPDGLWFSPYSKLLWIQTDDGAYTDITNCMLLAAQPGRVGDGTQVTIGNVSTRMGAKPTANTLKRFLVGPKDCEITGITETPDGKAMFINIQHPGENTLVADIADTSKYTSQWPSNAGYGQGKRPRSATIVITKKDGGLIGS